MNSKKLVSFIFLGVLIFGQAVANLGHSEEVRVPAYPGHWLSNQLPSLKNLTFGAAQLTLENKGRKLKKT